MKISLAKASILLALANTSLAHYIFQSLTVNGVTTEPFQYVRRHNNRNNPLKGFLSHEWIRCNKEAQSYASQTSTLKIAAGSTVSFVLDIDIWHPSVSAIYMTKVSKASTADGSTPWFKIHEIGATVTGDGLSFPSKDLRQITFKIPKSLPSGDYLLRAENIALHEANFPNYAEFYLSCAQVTITGGGSGKPGPTVLLPGGYSASDPGIHYSMYDKPPKSYKYPGPAVWTG